MEEKSKKIRAYLEKEKDEIFVCEKPGRYYLMDAFLDVSESEFAERTAELINFMRTTAKASVMRLVTSSMQKMSDGRSMTNYSNVILLMKHKRAACPAILCLRGNI